jgi:hypothetical protein
MCASHWDGLNCRFYNETQRRNESESLTSVNGGKMRACCVKTHARRTPEAFRESFIRLSKRTESVHAGTRKMVNYAWSGRSQGKP